MDTTDATHATAESAPLVDEQLEAQRHRPHRAAQSKCVEGGLHLEHGQLQVVVRAGLRPRLVRVAEPLRATKSTEPT